jgi:DNA-binding CsgD family transcriptional regulator/ArsR family metal-binding transcriptional regulator
MSSGNINTWRDIQTMPAASGPIRRSLLMPKNLDFTKAHETLSLSVSGPLVDQSVEMDCDTYVTIHLDRLDCGTYVAIFELAWDISPLFPYMNAVAERCQLYATPDYIKFVYEKHLCAFYPLHGEFSPVLNLTEAHGFLDRLSDFIGDIVRRHHEIVPNYKIFNPVSPLDIYRLLPGTNCRNCGYATCIAFAAALSRQKTAMDRCPYLENPVEEKAVFPVRDGHGKCVRTVSLDISTVRLRESINLKDAQIEHLQTQLADIAKTQGIDFSAVNARLPSPLTRREIQVLKMLAQGATNKEISSDLQISEHTVKSHVVHIFNKLGVNDRTLASVWAASQGLL